MDFPVNMPLSIVAFFDGLIFFHGRMLHSAQRIDLDRGMFFFRCQPDVQALAFPVINRLVSVTVLV